MIVLAALLAILVRLGGPLPPRYRSPIGHHARHLAAAFLDDRSWRAERLAIVRTATEFAIARQPTSEDIGRVIDATRRRAPARPADPQSVWPLIGRVPEFARAAA